MMVGCRGQGNNEGRGSDNNGIGIYYGLFVDGTLHILHLEEL